MTDYRAPWSNSVRTTTYLLYAVALSFSLGGIWFGVVHVRAGDPQGWIVAAVTLMIWPALLLFPLWAPKRYRISDSAVIVHKWIGDELIPFEKITSVEILDSGEVFSGDLRAMGIGGYHGIYGTFTGGALSSFRALVTNYGPLVVLRMKREYPIVLSPERPNEFVRELNSRTGVPAEEQETSA